jgi:phosphoketolase
MDKPNHITVAVIGDGESETGPTATAWHSHKYIDPKESGAVIPILHANGYKVRDNHHSLILTPSYPVKINLDYTE